MLTASNNIMQEEWVKHWLDRLTPKQKTLVIEVLEESSKHRTPSAAAISLADTVVTDCDSRKSVFNSKSPTCPG
jgi:hypothetical protein